MEISVKNYSELTLEDLYEILRLRSEVFVVEQNCFYLDVDGKDKYSIHVYIKEGNEILAYLRIIKPATSDIPVIIGRVLTKKEARGRGLARILMTKGIEIAKSQAPIIKIEAQAYLKNFYESLGFKACSEEFIHAGKPHINMQI